MEIINTVRDIMRGLISNLNLFFQDRFFYIFFFKLKFQAKNDIYRFKIKILYKLDKFYKYIPISSCRTCRLVNKYKIKRYILWIVVKISEHAHLKTNIYIDRIII